MKRKILLLTLAIPVMLTQNAMGQTASRLVAESHYSNNGASFTPIDSTNFTYSSGRGGDLKHNVLYDQSNSWTYDTAWQNAYQYNQTFDANSNVTSRIVAFWNGTGWTLLSNTLYTYNTSNQMTTMILQSWNGFSWAPVAQDIYSYNVAGKMVSDQYQLWNTLTSMFDPTSQRTYYYDVSGNVINETDQNLVGSPVYTNQWVYTYSTTNQLLTTTFNMWSGTAWNPVTLTTNTYDSSGNMTNQLYQTYDAGLSAWVNNTLDIYSGFLPGHLPSTDIRQSWNSVGSGSWDNNMMYTYSYNSFGQMTQSVGESWNIVGLFEFALGDPMYNYYYQGYTPGISEVKPVANNGGDAKIYPVPATGTLNVDLKWDNAQAADITICDATGKVVRHWNTPVATSFHSTVSVDNMSEGVYLIRVSGTQGQIVKQLVIAH